jgi:type 1 glutamine amidotransferase
MSGDLLFITQTAPYGNGPEMTGPYKNGPAGVHAVLTQAERAFAQIADLHGMTSTAVADVRRIQQSALHDARVLVLFTIGETPWTAHQRAAIMSRLRSGELGVVAIHSSTDSCYGWPEYGSIVGARFDGHPWTQTVTVDVCAPDHPACTMLGTDFSWHDEVYQFRDLRDDARVLLRVRDGQLDFSAPGAAEPSFGYPLSWCFSEGKGRVFSSSLGHFPLAWETPNYLAHLNGGVSWVLGEGH